MHSPATRAASQGISPPSWGSTRQSPGTSSLESTHSSSSGKQGPQYSLEGTPPLPPPAFVSPLASLPPPASLPHSASLPPPASHLPQPLTSPSQPPSLPSLPSTPSFSPPPASLPLPASLPPTPLTSPSLSPPPGRHTHTCTDSWTMSLRVWLCCGQGDKQGVGGRRSPRTPPALPHPPHTAHLSGLVYRHAEGDDGDEEDAQGVPVVVVSQPQPDAEGLEPIVGVQCLGEGRGGSVRARVPQGSPAAGWASCAHRSRGPGSCRRTKARPVSWSVLSRCPLSQQLLCSKEDTRVFTRQAPAKHII